MGTGDQPAGVRPVLGCTDATDVSNPLSWLRAPPCRRPGNPAGGSTGSTRHPERDRDSC